VRERLGIRRKRYALAVDTRKCIDCKACVVACKAENDVPPGRFRNRVNEESRGEYPHLSATYEPEQCHHCSSPSCVRVCPTGASYQREDGLVLVDADDCIGCGYCIIACPYDARFFNQETRVADLEDNAGALHRLLATRRSQVKKLETGNGPQLHYLL
jgi:tetrathionate reductase subunit B